MHLKLSRGCRWLALLLHLRGILKLIAILLRSLIADHHTFRDAAALTGSLVLLLVTFHEARVLNPGIIPGVGESRQRREDRRVGAGGAAGAGALRLLVEMAA